MPSAFSRVTRATDLTSASRQRTLDCGGLKLDIQVSVMGSHPLETQVKSERGNRYIIGGESHPLGYRVYDRAYCPENLASDHFLTGIVYHGR